MSELNSEADLVAVRPEADDPSGKLPIGASAWAIFEGARNPYVILVTIYIFAPYLVSVMIGNAVKGQLLVSQWNTYSSLIIMATAPFLGASIDQLGRRKPWLILVVSAMVVMSFSLWWAKPDHTGLSVPGVLIILSVMGVLFPYSEVLHNSLLVRAAGLGKAHRASGLALALGNASAVVALGFTAWAFALPGLVDWYWVPHAPLFGLDRVKHEPERIVAPMAAIIFALGAIPLFLFTPDAPSTGVKVLKAFGDGAKSLLRMVLTVKDHKDAAIFLLARMFYVDGMTAILVYAGIYLGGVMKWGPLDLLIYGIILSAWAVFGGFVGRWLDAGLGPRRAVQVEILMSLLGIILFLGNSPDTILYFWHFDAASHAPLWGGPVFKTLPDIVMLLVGFSNATFITAHYASSRTLLTRLTPPEQTGAFFGVYALSGTATLWLGNLMVNLGTRIFKTQQGGFATIILLLAIGFTGLLFVRGGNRPAARAG